MAGLDLGLTGKRALVCGSSAGMGYACAEALAETGADVRLNGRTEETLIEAADRIEAKTGQRPSYSVGDVCTAEGREKVLGECPDPDILINNAAGPPTGDFRDFDDEVWHAALDTSMISPIMMIKAVIDPMIERRWGRIVNITSSAVKAPLPLLGLSNGARSGLTGFIAGMCREVADTGVTINAILPGRIQTARLDSYVGKVADSQGLSFDEAATQMSAANPMKRFGQPEEIGAFCAFLCSRQAAYITGQNILIDGGEYPGL